MSKATRSVLLPRRLENLLNSVGEQIRAARLRRNLPIALIAERAQCSHVTVGKIEKGDPTVSMGAYLRVLYALQLADDIRKIAQDDPLGREQQDLELRKRASR